MPKRPPIRRVLAVACFVFLLIHPGCQPEDCKKGYKPLSCNETQPTVGTVRVQVTIGGMNPWIPITLFRGTVDENQVVLVDTLSSSSKDYVLPNDQYSVRATYRTIINGNPATVHSIDGGRLSSMSTEYCDGICYDEGTLELDAEYP